MTIILSVTERERGNTESTIICKSEWNHVSVHLRVFTVFIGLLRRNEWREHTDWLAIR